MKTEKILQEILIACSERNIDFSMLQEGDEIEVKFYEENPRYICFRFPDLEDKNIPKVLSEWLEKIKTIPS